MDLRNHIPTSQQLKPICQLFSAAVLVDASADVSHWASWTCLKIADPIVLHGSPWWIVSSYNKISTLSTWFGGSRSVLRHVPSF